MSKKKQKESVVEAPEEEKPETTIEESDVEEINVSWVLEIGDGVIEVKATGGDTRLG